VSKGGAWATPGEKNTALPGASRGLARCGAALVVWAALLTVLSRQFTYGSDMAARPIPLLIGLLMGGALVYFGAVWLAGRTAPTRRLALGVFAVGALMRLLVAPSQPILEDDFYRYLWDGAVTAHGHNPYTVIPGAVQSRAETVLPPLLALGDEAGLVLHRVNHPHLGTIYPPAAQAAFAAAHALTPWRAGGLRTLYFAADIAVFALLAALLKALGRSPLLVLIYWWNPLAVKEIYNSLHMDILLVPFLLAAVLLVLRGRPVWGMVPLACAAAVKLWPLLLLPPLAAAGLGQPRRALAAVLLFSGLACLLLSPALASARLGGNSGFAAYGARWEMNDALFMAFPWALKGTVALAGGELSPAMAHRGGKTIALALVLLTVGCVAVWTAQVARREGQTPAEWPEAAKGAWCRGLLWVTAALFLLSPTQFPWYFLWILPFLVLVPSRGLLTLTLMLPLYYLRFYFEARGYVEFFHYRVVWIEYAPVWALLLFDGWRSRPWAANRTHEKG